MSIEIRIGDINGVKVYLTNLGRKATLGVMDAAETVMTQAGKLGSAITHQGSTKRLHQAWVVSRTTNKVTLTNIMPYANREFSRGGNKVGGNPPLGSHNPVPQIIDLINSNLQPAINRVLQTGLPR